MALVLLDLSAAFDTINTKGVVTTLQQLIGVEGTALAWFEDYLTKRTKRIRIGKTVSDSERLTRGVPQGSVLGSVLFTAYTLPIAALCREYNVKYHMYADDTQLYVVFDPAIIGDRERALDRLKRGIQEIQSGMLIHELNLNDDKTEYIILQSKHHDQNYGTTDLDLIDFTFESGTSVRNLGAYFDFYKGVAVRRHLCQGYADHLCHCWTSFIFCTSIA